MHFYRWKSPILSVVAACAALVLALAGASGTAHANGSPCHATPDDGTTVFASADAHAIQQAVDASSADGHVKVAGNCVGTETIGTTKQSAYISMTLTLSGGYTTADWTTSDPNANPTIIDAANDGRVVRVAIPFAGGVELKNIILQQGLITGSVGGGSLQREGGAILSFRALTLTHVSVLSGTASGKGGGLYTGSTLHLTNTQFISNTSGDAGGGAYAENKVTSVNDIFEKNRSDVFGGGLNANGTLALTNTQFISNMARFSGGGVYALGAVTAVDSYFIRNTNAVDSGNGGGLYTPAAATLTNTHFLTNTTYNNGGGAHIQGATNVANSHFRGNLSTDGGGGGLFVFDTLSVTHTDFISNTATQGGGASAQYTSTVANSRFERNISTGAAGGLIANSTLNVTHTDFFSNTSFGAGAAVYVAGAAKVEKSRFQHNASQNDRGGGIYAQSTLSATDTIFAGNRAHRTGGGVHVRHSSGGASRIVNSLFARNHSGDGQGDALFLISSGASGSAEVIFTTIVSPTLSSGSAIEAQDGTVAITDTIVVSHAVGIRQVDSGVVSQDYNLLFSNTANTAGTVGGGANSLEAPPVFLDPASDDYHLTAASAGIDSGVDLGVVSDFEHDPRPQGTGFDMGYDESPFTGLQFIPQLTLDKAVSDASPLEGSVISYTVVVSNSGTGAATGAVISDVIPAGLTLVGGSARLDPSGAGTLGAPPHLVSGLLITANTAVTLTMQATVDIGAGGKSITNTAQITSLQVITPLTASATLTVTEAACYATRDDGATIFASLDAHAVQAAVDAASAGDHVKAAGRCVGVEEVGGTFQSARILKALTLSGGYTTTHWAASNPVANPTVIDAAGGGRALNILNFVPVEIVDLTLQGGQIVGDGGGILSNGALTLTGVSVLSSTASGKGGGLHTNSTLVLSNTRLISNTAGQSGGGAHANGTLTAEDGHVERNISQTGNGGGLYTGFGLYLTGVEIDRNRTHLDGGGAYAAGFANVTSSHFRENVSQTDDAGGLYVSFSLVLSGSQFISNTALGAGGGVRAIGAARATNSRFERNVSTGFSGGGLSAFTTLTLTNTDFISNTAQNRAGGAFANGTFSVVGGRFANNVATSNEGGGLYAFTTLSLASSHFVGNRSGLSGGGLYLFHDEGGASRVVNSLFARNQAGNGLGDALYLISPGESGTAEVIFTTVASPTVSGGSAIEIGGGSGAITDTIIVSHAVGIRQSGASVVGQDYNLFFGNTANTAGTVGGGANSLTDDPASVDAANDDYHLTATSYAVDAGVDLGISQDFEGDARPLGGGFDMGYDESPFTALTPQPTLQKTVSNAAPAIGDVVTYTIVVGNTGVRAATGGVITDLLPAGLTLVGGSVGLNPPGAGTVSALPQLVTDLTIAPGAAVTLTFQATVDVGTGGQALTNMAQLTAVQLGAIFTDSAAISVTDPVNRIYAPLILR